MLVSVAIIFALMLPSVCFALITATTPLMSQGCHDHGPARSSPRTCCYPAHPLPTFARAISPTAPTPAMAGQSRTTSDVLDTFTTVVPLPRQINSSPPLTAVLRI